MQQNTLYTHPFAKGSGGTGAGWAGGGGGKGREGGGGWGRMRIGGGSGGGGEDWSGMGCEWKQLGMDRCILRLSLGPAGGDTRKLQANLVAVLAGFGCSCNDSCAAGDRDSRCPHHNPHSLHQSRCSPHTLHQSRCSPHRSPPHPSSQSSSLIAASSQSSVLTTVHSPCSHHHNLSHHPSPQQPSQSPPSVPHQFPSPHHNPAVQEQSLTRQLACQCNYQAP